MHELLTEELKKGFEEMPQYREMLFRRGYLLTDSRIEDSSAYPFYGLWREISVGDYYLYVHKEQTCYQSNRDGLCSVIIGHAYNPFDMKWKEQELCEDLIDAYMNSQEDYFEKVSELTGLHVIILLDKDRLLACQDACSLTGCYFSS